MPIYQIVINIILGLVICYFAFNMGYATGEIETLERFFYVKKSKLHLRKKSNDRDN